MLHAKLSQAVAVSLHRPSLRRYISLLAVAVSAVAFGVAGALAQATPHAVDSGRAPLDRDKAAAFAWIDHSSDALKQLTLQIWNTPEVSFREFKTSRALMQYLASNGFTIQKDAGGLPTAFVASYGSGRPVIAFWTEEDALAGMSQKIASVREPLIAGAPGHACGHNVIGGSTAGAAVAVAKYLQRTGTKGTIRVYGTPAEETGGGKEFMLEAGLFKDVDVLLGWHPSGETRTEFEYTKAIIELHFHFKGVAAHASVSNYQGRNALQAVELMDTGVNFLREQLRDDVRISYVTTNGGGQPNVIPPEAESWYQIRANKHDEAAEVVQQVENVAKGAALMTGTQLEVRVDNDSPEVLPNGPLAEAVYRNLLLVGTPTFTDEERSNTLKLIGDTKRPPQPAPADVVALPEQPPQRGYSTDLGNVSWYVPTGRFAINGSPYPFAAHSWQVTVESATTSLKSVPLAAKTLAGTAIDCFKNPALVEAAKKDLAERTKGHPYTLLTSPDRPRPVYREDEGSVASPSSK